MLSQVSTPKKRLKSPNTDLTPTGKQNSSVSYTLVNQRDSLNAIFSHQRIKKKQNSFCSGNICSSVLNT